MEAKLCTGEEVIVVGAGNSAGQAAVFLSRTVARVHLLVRAAGLAATMSDYLVQRIASSPKITLHTRTEITALAGDTALQEVTWTNRQSGKRETHRVGSLFVMIGAEPNSAWLGGVAWNSIPKALSSQARTVAGKRSVPPLQPLVLAFMRWAMCGQDRLNELPRGSARVRWSCNRCISS